MPPELYDPAAPVKQGDGAPLFAWADAVIDALAAHGYRWPETILRGRLHLQPHRR